MWMIDNNMEGANVPMKDFTVAVICNNTGIVAITPLKHGDSISRHISIQADIWKNTLGDVRLKENSSSYLTTIGI